jgi:hypothetical protein
MGKAAISLLVVLEIFRKMGVKTNEILANDAEKSRKATNDL